MDFNNKQIIAALRAIAAQHPPNWQFPISSYSNFDWDKIGAKAWQSDTDGATSVCWMGHVYTRRAGAGKYGVAIWFSRAMGRDDDGETNYARLVTFKDFAKAEALPDDVRQRLRLRR